MTTVFTRRIIAYILDFLVLSMFMGLVSFLLYYTVSPDKAYMIYNYLPYVVPVLILIYFVLCEKIAGATIGKSIMRLEVKSRNGANISWIQAIVRNLTKIYWVPVIFDWLIGKFLRTDRLLNNITRTVVVEDHF